MAWPLPQPHLRTRGASLRENHSQESQHGPGPLLDLHWMLAPARSGLLFHHNLSQGRSKSYMWAELEVQHLQNSQAANRLAGWSGTWTKWNWLASWWLGDLEERNAMVLSVGLLYEDTPPCRCPSEGITRWSLRSQADKMATPVPSGSLSPAAPVLACRVHLQSGHGISKEAQKELNNSLPLVTTRLPPV